MNVDFIKKIKLIWAWIESKSYYVLSLMTIEFFLTIVVATLFVDSCNLEKSNKKIIYQMRQIENQMTEMIKLCGDLHTQDKNIVGALAKHYEDNKNSFNNLDQAINEMVDAINENRDNIDYLFGNSDEDTSTKENKQIENNQPTNVQNNQQPANVEVKPIVPTPKKSFFSKILPWNWF